MCKERKIFMEVKEYSIEREIDSEIIGLPEYFKKQRRVLQQANSELGDEFCSTQKIAENLELSADMLQKKLNGSKPLSREWLIAICAAFGLDCIRTNKVLNFASYPKLDFELPWELFISDFLNEKNNINRPHTLKKINDYLAENGCNEICSKFKRNKAVQSDSSNKKTEQYEIKKVVKTITDYEEIWSIGLEYDFRSRVIAVAYLIKDGETKYTLKVSSDGKHFSSEEKGITTTYENISETGDFVCYFSELLATARYEQKKVDFRTFDTKRYGGYRLSADVINDSLHVFCERFNYYTHERDEYYLLEYIDGHFRFSVSEQSMFMKEYLSEEEYNKHYGYIPESKRVVYNSYDELSMDSVETCKNMLQHRQNAFGELSKNIINTIRNFKNNGCIRHLDEAFKNPLDIFEYYHLEKDSDCTYDEEELKISPENKKINIPYDNETVCISIGELQRAFELGLNDCGQICRIKKKYGSIQGMVKNINTAELKKETRLL